MKNINTPSYWDDIYSRDEVRESKLAIDMIMSHVGNAQTILDVGCGYSDIIDALHSLYPDREYFGIDFSSKAIVNSAQRWPFAHYSVMEAERLEFDDSTFDLVFSNSLLEHVSRPGIVLDEMVRVSKHRIVVVTPYKYPCAEHMTEWDWNNLMGLVMERFRKVEVSFGKELSNDIRRICIAAEKRQIPSERIDI